MNVRKIVIAALLAVVLPMSSAQAFWGGNWMPWDWFDDDDYYGGPWGGYPGYGYGGYPGYGGYGGYPGGYGYGGYPGYGGW